MIFFFSSRRRHTRSKRDWSSDVCSSDLKERVRSHFGESVVQRSTGLISPNVNCARQHDVTGIKSFIHVHHSDSSLTIACSDGCLDWRGSAPPRQKRRMQIQTGNLRNLEYIARQDLSVCDDDDQIRSKSTNFFSCLALFDSRRL